MHGWLLVLFRGAHHAACARRAPEHAAGPYGHCDQQTLDTAIALERAGDREALRDHLRSYGCRLVYPREGLRPFPDKRKDRGERRREDVDE